MCVDLNLSDGGRSAPCRFSRRRPRGRSHAASFIKPPRSDKRKQSRKTDSCRQPQTRPEPGEHAAKPRTGAERTHRPPLLTWEDKKKKQQRRREWRGGGDAAVWTQTATHLRSKAQRRGREETCRVGVRWKCRFPWTASCARSRCCCCCGGRTSWPKRAAAPRCIRNRRSATPT